MRTSFREKISLAFSDPNRFFEYAAKGRFAARVEDGVLDIIRPMSDETVNALELRCLGMRRSGNHGIIEWLIDAVEAMHGVGSTVHLNNIPLGVNGYRSRHQYPEPSDPVEYTRCMGIRRYRNFKQTALLLRSYEDFTLARFRQKEPQKYYGQSERQCDVVIIRDPLNLFASRIKSKKIGTKSDIEQIDLYLDHFRGHLADETLLPIFYNSWLTNSEYRDGILSALGLPVGHRLNLISSYRGGGSSFVGAHQALDPNTLLRRWHSMRDDIYFRNQILGNSDLWEITETYFHEVL